MSISIKFILNESGKMGAQHTSFVRRGWRPIITYDRVFPNADAETQDLRIASKYFKSTGRTV